MLQVKGRGKFYQVRTLTTITALPTAGDNPLSQQIFAKISSFFPIFCTLCKNHYNSRMRALIWLKFDTCIGGQKKNTNINFGVNLFKL